MDTIDLAKTAPGLYAATAKVKEVVAAEASFLAVDGQSAPGGDLFHQALDTLFNVAFTMKFALKIAGAIDFKVSKLETLYFDDPLKVTDMNDWHWRVLIRVPDRITQKQVNETIATVREKKGVDASSVKLVRWAEGRCLQTMHVGPYERVGDTYRRLTEEARWLGLELTGPAHEIYMNDPRRTASEKLKTIIRMPLVR